MDKLKIPWIECVVKLPQQIEEEFNKLLSIYKKKSRMKKKLKKKIARITTKNIHYENDKNILKFDTENKKNTSIDYNILNKLTLFTIEQNKIIDYIDFIIKKYMNIYIHIDDQNFLISEKNKENNKIFLKFYFPQIINHQNNDNEPDIKIKNQINKFGDNIHFTILPDMIGHGLDGMIHLTFRIESKNGKPIYEYTKFISFNIIDDKVGIILYDDEKGNNAVIFKISNNFENFYKIITSIKNLTYENYETFIEDNTINSKVYKDICLYLALDIFKKLFQTKKINNFFTRYLHSYGFETIYKMINKLLSILLCTFIDLYLQSNKL